jgi:hypothetical protein
MSLEETIDVAITLTKALDELGIRYVIGGSLASSVHGVPRSTNDIDLLVELPGSAVDAFVSALGPTFYVDRDMVVDAIRRRASFNIIHLETMFKADLFVSDRRPLLLEEMERGETVELGENRSPVRVCSGEDIVVQKLDWFEKGGRVSDRQWKDLIGVLEIRGRSLDLDYIQRWARELDLGELVDKALAEAKLATTDSPS